MQWSCCSFSTYLFQYELKYLRGNIFHNTMSICVANVISEMLGNYIVAKVGTKKTFIYSYCLCLFSTVLILICQESMDDSQIEIVMPILLILASFGMMTSFMMCYVATFEFFPLKLR